MDVVNKRQVTDKKPTDIYIGRPAPLSNPYRITKGRNRSEAIELFKRYLTDAIDSDNKKIVYPMRFLRDEYRLVCFCKPKPCHGDVIVSLWEKYYRDKPLTLVFCTDIDGKHTSRLGRYAVDNCAMVVDKVGYVNSAYGIPILDKDGSVIDTVGIGRMMMVFKRLAECMPSMEFLLPLDCHGVDIVSLLGPMLMDVPENVTILGESITRYAMYRYCRFYQQIDQTDRYLNRILFDDTISMEYTDISKTLSPFDRNKTVVLCDRRYDMDRIVYDAARTLGYYVLDMDYIPMVESNVIRLTVATILVSKTTRSPLVETGKAFGCLIIET